jgi:uncharacterized membrane protein YczE
MERKIEFTPKKITFYILGFLILGLGVNIMARSDLGLGAWDTVTFNLNLLLNESITKGMTSWIISLSIMAFVVLYNKKWVLLFMIIPVLMVGFSIDFWDLLVFGKDYMPEPIVVRVLFYILGILIIPLGLASIVTSHFPAFVFDEWTLVVMDMFQTKSITKARLGIEILGILMGILFGVLAGVGFGYVSYGSVIFAVTLPPTFNFFVRNLGKLNSPSTKKEDEVTNE